MNRTQNKLSLHLYDLVKKKVDLSEFLETEIGCVMKWYEPNISAGTVCPMPHHKDSKPSFRIKLIEEDSLWIFHCLSGDTKVITWDGHQPIKNLAGTTHKILTDKGKWVMAPFFSFGHQSVSRIILSRNGKKKIIKATQDHRWFIRCGKKRDRRVERKTKDLKVGDRMSWVFPKNKIKQISALSPQGVVHGIVFGDGTRQKTMSKVDLWGKKNLQLLKWFPLNRNSLAKRSATLKGITIWDLPFVFKDLPSLSESPAYLAGFLAGWLAADGCVAKDGTVLLNSSIRENLEYVRLLAMRLGIGTYGITCRSRMGINNKMSDICQIHFITEDLNELFFLIDEHRTRFLNSKKKWMRRSWVVQSIQENIGIEEVFCAKVDGTQSFALEDNILTGNCLGCGAKGTIIDFFMEYYRINNSAEAVLRICKKFGFDKDKSFNSAQLNDIKKKVDFHKKLEYTHIVTSNQCRMLLQKDIGKYSKWIGGVYREMNDAMDRDDIVTIERISSEAHKKLMEKKDDF